MKTLLKRFAGVALAAWLAFFAAMMAAPAFAASNQEAESLMIRGDEYKNKGDYDKAIECYHQAITLKPDYAEPYFNRAVALEKLGRLKEAKLDYAKACALNPSNADYADDKRRSENW